MKKKVCIRIRGKCDISLSAFPPFQSLRHSCPIPKKLSTSRSFSFQIAECGLLYHIKLVQEVKMITMNNEGRKQKGCRKPKAKLQAAEKTWLKLKSKSLEAKTEEDK